MIPTVEISKEDFPVIRRRAVASTIYSGHTETKALILSVDNDETISVVIGGES